MGHKRIPGLYKRRGVWHIDKYVFGRRLYENTGTSSLAEAEKVLARRIEKLREAQVFGVRPTRTFREAATKYLRENMQKASIDNDALHISQLDPYIGSLTIAQIHTGSLQSFVETRQKQGRKAKTINLALGVVRRILNLAAAEWMDENGLTWLAHAPKIKLLPLRDQGQPYPLSRVEQERLFKELPKHLRQMCLFKVNTGCRDQEVCQLRWEWEIPFPELNTSVFVIPAWIVRNGRICSLVKNGKDRLVVLNDIAKSVVDSRRGIDPVFVFTYAGHPLTRMFNTAWLKARTRADLPNVRIHDLKHTFGRRLRAAGVSFEDRQDLLGHHSGRITTHYSAAELNNLIQAANKVCQQDGTQSPVFTMLRSTRAMGDLNKMKQATSHQSPTIDKVIRLERIATG